MFSKEEIKAFVVSLGKKWFFPDFSNKITWYAITLGGSVILAPIPLKVVIANFMINSFNLNSGGLLTLAEMSNPSADYWLGSALIAIALAHNVFSKWLVFEEKELSRARDEKQKEIQIKTDARLFREFIELLPTSAGAAQFLEQHNFWNTFDLAQFKPIDVFIYDWGCPEKSFLDESLELTKNEFLNKSRDLSNLIGQKTGPTRTGRQSVVPDEYLGEHNVPKQYHDDVTILNKKATELFNLHQKLVRQCRQKLMC